MNASLFIGLKNIQQSANESHTKAVETVYRYKVGGVRVAFWLVSLVRAVSGLSMGVLHWACNLCSIPTG